MSGLFLDYESEGFPPPFLPNTQRRLNVTWDEILWAALTVGRPNVFHVFQHGSASVHEAMFRWSMVRMALQQRGVRNQRLVRTELFRQMDPTEKGAVNYFFGLLTCKLFSARLLDAPWSLHLDVFRPALNPRLTRGRSRPDMVAECASTGQWHAFECKGRASIPSNSEKQNAKAQALRLVSVNGIPCTLHIGAITFFRNDALQFYWRDPEPTGRERIEIPKPDWRQYYEPCAQLLRHRGLRESVGHELPTFARIEELDLSLEIHPIIASALLASDWEGARDAARVSREALVAAGFQMDGMLVKAGPSWLERFDAVVEI
ncbi:hypothetical protein [Bradyrhizobium yuanmingense]|uniref:hypothetical protein n=1 Tax=Bradyrhizobium yuanmingense TaxID=108015 RepID=UPI003513E1F8